MTTEQKQEMTVNVIIAYAKHIYYERKVNSNLDETLRRVTQPGLEDAQCLIRLAVKEMNAHNAKMDTKISLLEKLRRSDKYLQSNLFAGISIPVRKIEKLIDEFPDKGYYEIYRMLILH